MMGKLFRTNFFLPSKHSLKSDMTKCRSSEIKKVNHTYINHSAGTSDSTITTHKREL